jgi:hypothetical protein
MRVFRAIWFFYKVKSLRHLAGCGSTPEWFKSVAVPDEIFGDPILVASGLNAIRIPLK